MATTPQSGAFQPVEVTWASRTSRSAGKTSPEELLAAAHAGCLTMGIATELTEAGTPPVHLELTCRIVMDEVEKGTATAGRQFVLGAPCPSATQFIGLIPPGRAPDHFHYYDEVIYVLEGEGYLDISGEQAPIGPGTCIHLPKTLVHSLANTGDGEMRVLGVFRPAGSPAEAYYPDGTRAGV